MFQQNKKPISIMVIKIIRPKSVRTDLFCKQTSLNLVIFNKNKGNFKEKKIFRNVKSQFVNGGLPLISSSSHPGVV